MDALKDRHGATATASEPAPITLTLAGSEVTAVAETALLSLTSAAEAFSRDSPDWEGWNRAATDDLRRLLDLLYLLDAAVVRREPVDITVGAQWLRSRLRDGVQGALESLSTSIAGGWAEQLDGMQEFEHAARLLAAFVSILDRIDWTDDGSEPPEADRARALAARLS